MVCILSPCVKTKVCTIPWLQTTPWVFSPFTIKVWPSKNKLSGQRKLKTFTEPVTQQPILPEYQILLYSFIREDLYKKATDWKNNAGSWSKISQYVSGIESNVPQEGTAKPYAAWKECSLMHRFQHCIDLWPYSNRKDVDDVQMVNNIKL